MSKKSIVISAALCVATGVLSGFVLFTMGRARGFEAAESSIAAETTTTESTTTTETTTTESTTESTTTTTTEMTLPPMNDDDTSAVVQKSYKTGYNEGYNQGLKEGAEAQIRIYEGQGITPPPAQKTQVQTASKRTVTVSGSFTVTVRALIPDYVTDYTTPRAAVVTLYQGEPVVLKLNDTVCSRLTVGQTYTFLVADQSVSMDASLLNSDGTVSRDALAKRSFHLSNFRAPEEGENSANCWRVKYQ